MPAEVLPALTQLVADVEALAARTEPTQPAGRVRAVLEQTGSRPTLVVAGEAGRGKSRLVNALIGRPGLLPVEEEDGSGAYVVLDHAATPQARAHLTGEQVPRDIAVEEVAEWASISANPGNERGVRYVEVGLDAPLLEHLRIIDTPGVGGLDEGHAALTMEALSQADALLFVVDAGAPLTAPELRFLARAAQRIDTVIIALARIDLYRGWETVARDDAALLREHAPRFAASPLLPVSSMLAERARDRPAGEAEALRHESGIDALQAALVTHVIDRAGVIRLANAVHAADSELGAIEQSLVRAVAATAGGGDLQKSLEGEQGRLRELARESAEWRMTLDTAIRRISLDRGDELRRSLVEVQQRYTDRAGAAHGRRVLEALPAQVMAEVAALATRITHDTAMRIMELAQGIVGAIETAPELIAVINQTASAGFDEIGVSTMPTARQASASDRVNALVAFSTGHSIVLGIPAMGLALGAAPLAIVGIGVGAAFSLILARGRNEATLRNDFRNWLRDQINAAQLRLSTDFSRHILDFQEEVRNAVMRRIDTEQQRVNAELASTRRALDEDVATRRRRTVGLERELAAARELRARAAELHRALEAQPQPGGAAAATPVPSAPAPAAQPQPPAS